VHMDVPDLITDEGMMESAVVRVARRLTRHPVPLKRWGGGKRASGNMTMTSMTINWLRCGIRNDLAGRKRVAAARLISDGGAETRCCG
jgi:hypothetical protein